MNAQVNVNNVVLKTERLILRPFEEGDLDDFYQYASVPGVGEMAGWRHHESKADTLAVLHRFIDDAKTFAIVFDGKVIGSVGIETYDENRLPELHNLKGREIGYVLSEEFWGRGLMPEAVSMVIEYCFDELKLDVLVCGHDSANVQSARVQEKCGFAHYKTFKRTTQCGDERTGWYSLLGNGNTYVNLLLHMRDIHTTKLGYDRIFRATGLVEYEALRYVKDVVRDKNSVVSQRGKNLYVLCDDVEICINASTFCVITAKKVGR